MQEYDHTNEQERFFVECVKGLEKVNKQLAQLTLRKEELTNQIIGVLEHEHEGQKTYEYGVWKLEIKTPFVYSLNKKLYESGAVTLPEGFNPVKQSVAYSIDKRLCEQFMRDAPKEVRDTLAQLIDKKPGKASVSVKERI